MAKWEERDPRWIVEERPDAKNVNSWHWEEKNCSEWASKRLKELFLEIKGEYENTKFRVTNTEKCSGELNWYNRKGKRFILFELDISVAWEAELGEEKVNGLLSASEVAQDEEARADWSLKVKEGKLDNNATKALKSALIKEMVVAIRQMMDDLFKLQEEKIPKSPNEITKNNQKQKLEFNNQNVKEEEKEFGELTLNYNFQSNPSDLYDCLLNPQRIPYYTRSPAQIDPKVGGKFDFYNGAIVGEFVELQKDSKIVMKWKLKDWKVFSVVTLTFKKENGTFLSLHQSNIPSFEFERTKAGWKNYFWEPIRVVFGFSYTQK